MPIDHTRRKRRLASDEAHAWARSLRLGNPYAKSILKSLALHVDYEGKAFVSIGQLAEDCDLSEDTVRRRLRFLEDVGAIIIFPCWIDAQGRRNTEGRGKRTTDDIRLLVDADPDAIEAAAAGKASPEPVQIVSESLSEQLDHAPAISPSQQQGLNQELGGALVPPPGVCQPSQSCDHLISEPEPEPLISPQPLSEGPLPEVDDFKEFEAAWDEPMTRPSMARQAWSGLTAEERILVKQAASGYRLWRRQQAKPPHLLGAHIFLKERDSWPRFAGLAQKTSPPDGIWISEGSDEDRALRFLRAWAKIPSPMVRKNPMGGPPGYPHAEPVGLDILAMLTYAAQSRLRWALVEVGSDECSRWRQRMHHWVGGELRPEPGEHGIRVPSQYPPSKQGVIYADANDERHHESTDSS